MKFILTLIFLLLVIGAFVEYFRKRSRGTGSIPDGPERLLSADDAPPTETGRMKVQSILNAIKTKDASEPAAQSGESEEALDEEELPDPFDSDKPQK